MILEHCKNYKIILIGNSAVGKTSIMNHFSKKSQFVAPTIGTEFCMMHSKKFNHKLQIWDCAGQEKYRALTRIYYRDVQGCVLVFSLNDVKTLYDIRDYWINEIEDNNMINPIFILVGNKSDLSINTDYDVINDLVRNYNMKYIETSVIKDINISEIFDSMSVYLSTNSLPEYNHEDILNKQDNISYYNNISGYC